MRKIVIGTRYTGFALSDLAIERYASSKGLTLHPGIMPGELPIYWTVPSEARPEDLPEPWSSNCREAIDVYIKKCKPYQFDPNEIPRDDPDLIRIVEELGIEANKDTLVRLKIVKIPEDVQWEIEPPCECCGERVVEKHRVWQ